jgi:ribonuclease HI
LGRKYTELTAFVDGASSGNPGHAGAGVLFCDSSQREVETLSVYLGETTNNVAEYQALILALERAAKLGVRRLAVFSDSELVVKQFTGRYRVKDPGLRPYFERAQELQRRFESLEIRHMPREDNKRANQLARQAASRRATSPDGAPPLLASSKLVKGALSLNEVSLLPVWSDLLPAQVQLETRLVGDIELGIPLLSAAVASRGSTAFAIAVAQVGGMAILRPGRSPQLQAEAVRKIKGAKERKGSPDKAEAGAGLPNRDEQGRYRVGSLVYPSDDLLNRVENLVKAETDLVVLEASLGRGPELLEGIAQIKREFPEVPLISGDITDARGAQRALESGADGIKIGAPFLLGVKVPLFTALQDCAQVLEKLGGILVADVGTTKFLPASSRIARAIGAGAHVALVTFEPADTVKQAQMLAEDLNNLIEDLCMIMSCCGARTIEELRRNAQFIRVRGSGES